MEDTTTSEGPNGDVPFEMPSTTAAVQQSYVLLIGLAIQIDGIAKALEELREEIAVERVAREEKEARDKSESRNIIILPDLGHSI